MKNIELLNTETVPSIPDGSWWAEQDRVNGAIVEVAASCVRGIEYRHNGAGPTLTLDVAAFRERFPRELPSFTRHDVDVALEHKTQEIARDMLTVRGLDVDTAFERAEAFIDECDRRWAELYK